jgi:hypothetical protein
VQFNVVAHETPKKAFWPNPDEETVQLLPS